MVVKSLLCSPFFLFLMLTVQLDAQENRTKPKRIQINRICKFVSYQPKTLSGCGLLLDLASIDSTKSLSLSEKRELIRSMQAPDKNSAIETLNNSAKISQFLHLVKVQIDLTEKSAVSGEAVDCSVTSLSGEPLTGGYLLPTEMRANCPSDSQVYGIAGGFVSTKDSSVDGGTISSGCRILVNLTHVITKEGEVVLLINDTYAGLQIAQDIAETLTSSYEHAQGGAVVLDERHVKISVPNIYSKDIFAFASDVLDLQAYYVPTHLPVAKAVALGPEDLPR